jgi:hypothetical protein
MKTIKKAVKALIKTIGAIAGMDVPTASDYLTRNYPYWAHGC